MNGETSDVKPEMSETIGKRNNRNPKQKIVDCASAKYAAIVYTRL